MGADKEYVLIATGDVGVHREVPDSMFQDVQEDLDQADLIFGQLEAPISDRGTPHPQSTLPCRLAPPAAEAIKKAGYAVMSFAGNHSMDYGTEAFADTLEHCNRVGIELIGAGPDIESARKPVIRTLPDGTKIGFLGYSSIAPEGYWATEIRCGFAPMRGLTVAAPVEHDQPETAVTLYSFPHPIDLENMLADIRSLRPQVDILAVSIHWGVHFTPAAIGWYQKFIGHFAIDEGADIILGHHAHIMKPVEVYKGKPIIYCMSNFAFEGPQVFSPIPLHKRPHHANIAARNPETSKDPTKQMPTDSYKSYYLKCIISNRKIQRVYLVPCQLDAVDCHPCRVHEGDDRFTDIFNYLQSITEAVNLPTQYRIEDDAIRLVF